MQSYRDPESATSRINKVNATKLSLTRYTVAILHCLPDVQPLIDMYSFLHVIDSVVYVYVLPLSKAVIVANMPEGSGALPFGP